MHVRDDLEQETDAEHYDAGDVRGGAERHVIVGGSEGGRVSNGDGQGDGPYPEHLEDPKGEEGEEAATHLVEARVMAGADDAVEEEPGEAEGPDAHEDSDEDLAGGRVLGE